MKKGQRAPVKTDDFSELLQAVTARVRRAQTQAVQAVNAELLRLYWDVGQLLEQRKQAAGWGAGTLERLASSLRNEIPEVKGFSKRNLHLMVQFAAEYPLLFADDAIVQPPVAQLKRPAVEALPIAQLPWAHNVLLMQRVKNLEDRRWYMVQTLTEGWSRNVLAMMIDAQAHRRAGQAVTNFSVSLPQPQSDLAQQALKDPYIFDFLTLDTAFRERELETELVRHLERFLLELGQGFAFVGRQYRIEVSGEDYYIDLLFYHLRLRAFVVIELKAGEFKPEYAGKLNFYCNVVNDVLRHADDQPTIGLILCQSKDNVLAEYALIGIDKPIGVSSYEFTRALPSQLRSALPTVEQIEAELGKTDSAPVKKPRVAKPKKPRPRRKPKGKG